MNANGLLHTVNVDAEDKTPAIIDTIATTIVDVFKVAAETGKMSLEGSPPFNYVFDPLDKTETDDVMDKMGKRGFKLTVTPSPSTVAAGVVSEGTKETTSATSSRKSNGQNPGVFYRPPTTVELQIESSGTLMERVALRVPDKRSVAMLSLTRSGLIKKSTHISFNNGDLGGFTYTKPSQALAVVGIPASIAKKAAEAVPAIVKIQDARATHAANQRKAQLDAEAAVLQSQAALIQAKAALEAAKKQSSGQ